MMPNILKILFLAAAALSCAGCGHFSLSYLNKKETSLHEKIRKEGYDLCHLQSCGPDSLSDALKQFNINKTPFQIGKEIQDNDFTRYRCILGILHEGFYSITCPSDLKKYIRKQGFSITETKDISGVSPQDTAIFLLKGTDNLRDWHWITYPTSTKEHILNFFNKDTKVKTIYILTKK